MRRLAFKSSARLWYGFAACCEDVAPPFRNRVLFLWAMPWCSPETRGDPIKGHSPKLNVERRTEGRSHILTTGGEAVSQTRMTFEANPR